MDPNSRMLALGAGGVPATDPLYVEDVFSTWLYTGNNSTQTITNGIDLAGEGGLVWMKSRTTTPSSHVLCDTARGKTKLRSTNSTNSDSTTDGTTQGVTSFNSDGFSLGTNYLGENYATGPSTVSWTFRKQAKFFDVVTYTGNGSNRTIVHSLGSVPGCIIVKRTDTTSDWQIYHRSLANTEYMVLNSTAAKATGTTRWNSTTPTSTEFSLGTDATVNANGSTYVAYLFAHDAGGFGLNGNENVVSCGSFTTDASGNATVTLGWEPQWMLIKRSDGLNSWWLCDAMRGLSQTSFSYLSAEATAQEATYGAGAIKLNPTGCSLSGFWPANASHIYIAIRRGPMKTPTDATKVFATEAVNPSSGQSFSTGFPVDMTLASWRGGTYVGMAQDRLRGFPLSNTTGGHPLLQTSSTAADPIFASSSPFIYGADSNTSVKYGGNLNSTNPVTFAFRRAPGFFDVVAYTGTGAFGTAISHNLGVAPELIILKSRSAASTRWPVYQKFYPTTGGNLPEYGTMFLNTTDGWASGGFAWANTTPSATTFSVGFTNEANASGVTYIAYLFASCPGVSKVGSYTGTGTTKDIDCGFTNGARFVLIKRTDSTGDWYVWDTARGIVSGNDPFLLLNSTAAEDTSTDYIDPLSSGFQISSTAPAAINANGGSFVFLAIS